MNRPRATAYTATAVIALLTIVGLRNGSLEFDTRTLRVPPRPVTELVEIEDEEFVDIYNPSGNSANPAPAVAKENAHSRSTPASATGTDLSDAGKEAAAPVPPNKNLPSPHPSHTQVLQVPIATAARPKKHADAPKPTHVRHSAMPPERTTLRTGERNPTARPDAPTATNHRPTAQEWAPSEADGTCHATPKSRRH